MLKTLIDFKPTETVTLIPNSGVQFIDFGFTLAGSRRLSRSFAFVPEGEVAKGSVSIFPLEPGPDDTQVYRRPGDPQQGGLARAVVPEQRDDLAVVHLQAQAPQCVHAVVVELHIAQYQRAHSSPSR